MAWVSRDTLREVGAGGVGFGPLGWYGTTRNLARLIPRRLAEWQVE